MSILGGAWGGMLAATCWLMLRAPTGQADWFPHADKVWHFIALGALAVPLAVALPSRHHVFAGSGLIMFAAGIEAAQQAMGLGRTADVWDLAAGAAGAAAAIAVGARVRCIVLRHANSWAARSAK
ncbi:hypothetical protein GC169_12920 [bacterium]|nr:hypothetical protein [bacterium]